MRKAIRQDRGSKTSGQPCVALAVLVSKLVPVCKAYPSIAAAYIFGSRAKGREHTRSDLDIALLLFQGQDLDLLEFMTRASRDTGLDVDAVILNRAGQMLRHRVRREGILFFERDRDYRKRFDVLNRKFFDDYVYFHEKYSKRRILKD